MEKETFLKNGKLVSFVIRKFFSRYSNDEDVFQEGWIGLCYATKKYKEGKVKNKFSTYACRCIRNQIIKYLKKEEKENLYKKNFLNDFDIRDKKDFFCSFIDDISKEQKDIILLIIKYGEIKIVAEKLGKSEYYIRKQLRKIKRIAKAEED